MHATPMSFVLSLCVSVSAVLAQPSYVDRLNQTPDAARLRAWHDMVASEPHIAGTEGDRHVIESLAGAFAEMGYEVEQHEIWPLLSYPVSAEVEVLHPSIKPGWGMLPLQETAIAEDGYSADARLTIGFNAYSGSGEAIGEVVYANFGRKEDFEQLAAMGIDCTGKIVIARFGGNYRGYKAKFAEEAGAAGLLIYLDPGDTGYVRGEVYPAGGWQTDSCIQRGSIMTLPYKGDPLTPFVEATEHAERLDEAEVALPRIPVQPIGWGAARQIIVRMDGPEAPEAWRGGLPMSYPLTGGSELRVRVNVQQDRRIAKTANVIARLEGSKYPDQWVIVGCHHDAWGFGASDPTSGLISMLESARSFAELARAGHPPERTIIFCAWAAEEFGIIGSSEWVEANADELREKAVAYINLDMASMGPNFRASATPTLRRLVDEAAGLVPQARAADKTVREDWVARAPRADDPTRPRIGNLGGGSDHVAFVCHIGVPGVALGAGGSAGSAYHTAYDTLAWYRKVVGEDYEPALMIARMTNAVAGRLVSEAAIPIDPTGDLRYIGQELRVIAEDPFVQDSGYSELAIQIAAEADRVADMLNTLDAHAAQFGGALVYDRFYWNLKLDDPAHQAQLDQVRQERKKPVLLRDAYSAFARRHWQATLVHDPEGLVWNRNTLISPDPNSGYGSWTIPFVRQAIQERDAEKTGVMIAKFSERIATLRDLFKGFEVPVAPPESPE